MAAPYWAIESKIESALVALLTAQITPTQLNGASILAYIAGAEVTADDRIVCQCVQARGRPGLAGNCTATIEVDVRAHIAPESSRVTAVSDHWNRVGYVRDVLMDGSLDTLLSAEATDFSVQGVDWSSVVLITETEDDVVSSIWRAEIVVGPKD